MYLYKHVHHFAFAEVLFGFCAVADSMKQVALLTEAGNNTAERQVWIKRGEHRRGGELVTIISHRIPTPVLLLKRRTTLLLVTSYFWGMKSQIFASMPITLQRTNASLTTTLHLRGPQNFLCTRWCLGGRAVPVAASKVGANIARVGHNRVYTPYLTKYWWFPCQKYRTYTVYIWYMVLVNPKHSGGVNRRGSITLE